MVRDVPAGAWEEGEYRGAEPYRPPRERERERERDREHSRPNNDRWQDYQLTTDYCNTQEADPKNNEPQASMSMAGRRCFTQLSQTRYLCSRSRSHD